jgi:hypothetical protein
MIDACSVRKVVIPLHKGQRGDDMETEPTADSPDAYRAALKLNPVDERATNNLLVVLVQTGRLHEARELCGNFLAAGGVSAMAAVNAVYMFAHIFYDEGGISIACSLSERARRYDAENATIWNTSYFLSSIQQDHSSAMSYAAKAASLDPGLTFQYLRINTPFTV